MSHRPLVPVSGLTFGDYLLWSWSLNTNHDVLALVSGLTLPPLAVLFVWLLALTLTRMIARAAGRPLGRISAAHARSRASHRPSAAPQPPVVTASPEQAGAASTGPQRKLAA